MFYGCLGLVGLGLGLLYVTLVGAFWFEWVFGLWVALCLVLVWVGELMRWFCFVLGFVCCFGLGSCDLFFFYVFFVCCYYKRYLWVWWLFMVYVCCLMVCCVCCVCCFDRCYILGFAFGCLFVGFC